MADCISTAFLYAFPSVLASKRFSSTRTNVSTVHMNVDFLRLVDAVVMSPDDLLLTVILWLNSKKRFSCKYYTNTYLFHLY